MPVYGFLGALRCRCWPATWRAPEVISGYRCRDGLPHHLGHAGLLASIAGGHGQPALRLPAHALIGGGGREPSLGTWPNCGTVRRRSLGDSRVCSGVVARPIDRGGPTLTGGARTGQSHSPLGAPGGRCSQHAPGGPRNRADTRVRREGVCGGLRRRHPWPPDGERRSPNIHATSGSPRAQASGLSRLPGVADRGPAGWVASAWLAWFLGRNTEVSATAMRRLVVRASGRGAWIFAILAADR